MPYTPPPLPPHQHHQMYHGYQQHPYSHGPPTQHFPPQPSQQWYQYPHQMARTYQQYSHMTNASYPVQQNLSQVQHQPHPLQHQPSSSSVLSHQNIISPSSSSTSLHVLSLASGGVPNAYVAPLTPPPPPARRMPYYPPLPWFSFTEGSFPSRDPRRRRKRPAPQSSSISVELPLRNASSTDTESVVEETSTTTQDSAVPENLSRILSDDLPRDTPEDQLQSYHETPLTSNAPSEADSTQPTTPSSAVAPAPPRQQSMFNNKPHHRAQVSIIPAIPNIPPPARPSKRTPISLASDTKKAEQASDADHLANAIQITNQAAKERPLTASDHRAISVSPPAKIAPKSWAELVKTMAPPLAPHPSNTSDSTKTHSNGFAISKAGSLADALSSFKIDGTIEGAKVSFLEPRGLVNTGNMCYMNSILQILVFCVPFYDFLEKVGKRAAHSFQSDTPLVDAMILFMREFPVIDSAVSVTKLRMRLRENELEQYGEAFVPEFVYGAIRRLPRFSSMIRGHQQDAEEFLGFILEEMHDECSRAMRLSTPKASSGASTPTNDITSHVFESTELATAGDGGWLEVGPKQKAAVTRSSGTIATESPITKIFGGKLRSELRVPGMKNSVTLEPYQPLQLDIGAVHVNNIVDALKGLTRPETLHGDFNSPRGPAALATKQVTIETLPPVLILHLKRFQYDNAGGTQKIWKKIGYPLELEIPKEVFPQHKRGALLAHGGLPRYRLIGVVYHHGKNASGGHYTVDVRRQEGREWIRLDDTVIRRVRSEDVAEGGNEEDPKILAAALEQHKNDQSPSRKDYDQCASDGEEQAESEKGWNQVNGVALGATAASKKWSGIVNGNVTPTVPSGKATPVGRSSLKDNKVAYLLFYQKVGI